MKQIILNLNSLQQEEEPLVCIHNLFGLSFDENLCLDGMYDELLKIKEFTQIVIIQWTSISQTLMEIVHCIQKSSILNPFLSVDVHVLV